MTAKSPRSTLRVLRAPLLLASLAAMATVSYCPTASAQDQQPHPALEDAPELTHTSRGFPGDPINVALVATEEELHLSMRAAHWYPADPITLKTSIRIVADTVEHRKYDDAPVSHLYLWGRKQDLAFEQPVGNSPKQRHHVRFWRSARVDATGRPLWLGAATFDRSVGISRTTGGVTHHIAPEIDLERDKIIGDIRQGGVLGDMYWIEGFQESPEGQNGGGDPYRTDARLAVGVIQLRR